jgi:hypothetical protein
VQKTKTYKPSLKGLFSGKIDRQAGIVGLNEPLLRGFFILRKGWVKKCEKYIRH